MRIAITIRTFYPKSGGLQAHAEKLARELISRGHQVTIFTRSISHSPSYQDYFFFSESVSETKINDLEVKVLRHPKLANILMWVISKCIHRTYLTPVAIYLINIIFTGQILKHLQGVDVIHHVGQAHELIGFAAATAAHRINIPFLIQPTLHPNQWGDSKLDIALYSWANHLLVHTKFEQQSLEKYNLKGIYHLVGNGVDDRNDGNGQNFRDKYNINSHMVLFLGRKSIDKGYPLIKQAFKLLLKERSDVTLVCMGPSEHNQQPEVRESGIVEIYFADEKDKHDALSACTMLCVPSEGESFGLVYMEAGRYKKPVIARNLPVLKELLGQYQAALLVGSPYGEGNQVKVTPEELRDAMNYLINNHEVRKKIGKNAYKVSENFTWSKVVSLFENAYNQARIEY
ncbi:MAG: glycosyltransferase family 4 protein [Pseudanabaenaceae cyanobacterium bins.39]|nr:glycosyltransferase family 4 protein [Pseudanabaenaceae cyanobacterium bins.39]